MSAAPVYAVWRSMRARCYLPSDSNYSKYGAKGIRVCTRWGSFENFIEDMGVPGPGLSIDRINPRGDYEPANCRWATRTTQARNRTDNRLTAALVSQIRWLSEMGYPQRFVARAYGVSQRWVGKIVHNTAWA